jgi:hypothetical protein
LALSLSFARKTCSTSLRNTKGWSLMQPSPKILEVSIEQNKQSSSRAVLQNHCAFWYQGLEASKIHLQNLLNCSKIINL